jgi:hypothetical protein
VRPKARPGSPTTMAWTDSSLCEARLDADRQYVEWRGRMGGIAPRAVLRCMIGVPWDFTIPVHRWHQRPSSTDRCQSREAGASCQEAYGVTPRPGGQDSSPQGTQAAFLDSFGQLLGGKPLSEGEEMRRPNPVGRAIAHRGVSGRVTITALPCIRVRHLCGHRNLILSGSPGSKLPPQDTIASPPWWGIDATRPRLGRGCGWHTSCSAVGKLMLLSVGKYIHRDPSLSGGFSRPHMRCPNVPCSLGKRQSAR